jgi:hypothetical protein
MNMQDAVAALGLPPLCSTRRSGIAIEIEETRGRRSTCVVAILGGASAWLRRCGVFQRLERFPEDLLLTSVSNQELYLMLEGAT